MAPKNRRGDQSSSPAAAASPASKSATSGSSPSTPSSTPKNSNDAQAIVQGIWQNYVDKTPQRTKLIDAFMAFLVVVGALQFVYCVIVGNYVSSH